MIAKRSSRALALLLALPSAAFALGLGDIRLLSPLNAPLDAEIEVTDIAPDEINTLQTRLAPRDIFAQNGLDYPAYLNGVQVRLGRTADGREIIKLKSADPITDPFVTLLIQVGWSHGQLVREYTMLLDPPVYTPGQPAVANAPVNAPVTAADTRAGTIARTEAPAPPAAAVAAPAAVAEPAASEQAAPEPAPSHAATATAAPEEPAAAAAAASPPAAPASAAAPSVETAAGSTHTVQRGETLSQIARSVTGSSTTTARTQSWMLAIYQANPRAFEQNMNVLRSGAVLRIPDAAQADAVAPAEAAAEIRRQYTAWRSSAGGAGGESAGAPPTSGEAPAAKAAQPGRLHLVTPSEPGSAGTAGANGAQVAALNGRVQELEGQLAESKRLLDLKNADLARLQAQLAAQQSAAKATPPPAPTPPAVAPAPVEKAPAAKAEPPVAPPSPAPQAEQPSPAPPVATATPPPPKPIPVTKPLAAKPAPAESPPAEGGSILDTIIGYWWVLALVALVLGAVAALRFVRSRRASEFDDSLGRLAVAAVSDGGGAFGGAGGGAAPARGLGGVDTPMMRATKLAEPEPSVVVEETGTHERPRFAAGPAAAVPAPKHVTADDTISSETAINLDQGDPLAEADFHMAYGLYDQAADLIRIAIGREPARRDLKLKLLEVFFVWGNKEQFLQTAHELAQSRSEAAPGEWEKILIMGKQLAPEDPLFSGGAAVSGATAGGVDLNLEGGQSRVDFDLLGEPVPTDVPQGVDLDIGAAVGEAEGTAQMTEATTSVTDRNLALSETRLGDATATGSTRQMTSKMRQPSQGEAEGPTVEQPRLAPDGGPTIRKKVESVLRQTSHEQTAELAVDDLGLDLGQVDTAEQPALTAPGEAPTLVAGLDEQTRRNLEDTAAQAAHVKTSTTGQWQFDQEELESALTHAGPLPEGQQTSRLASLRGDTVDVDLRGEATGTHAMRPDIDLDVGATTQPGNGGNLDLDVGTATVPDAAFAATQRLASEDLALPDLEPVTMSEVGTKLDLARAYMDMGDPDGARNILEEVLSEGSAAQKQEAQRLMESLPG
jgi:pilus assembly protein FimV